MMSLCLVRRRVASTAAAATVAANRRPVTSRSAPDRSDAPPNRFAGKTLLLAIGGGLAAYAYARHAAADRSSSSSGTVVHAFTPKKWKDDTEKAVKLTSRERRFIKFASAEFDGQLYMTPQDFLDSVVEQDARRK